jgi:hypothetical protein
MFEQLLSNKNKNTTVQHSATTVIRGSPIWRSKQGLYPKVQNVNLAARNMVIG